jgi:predicted RNase H-like HicB family nuclease
MNKLKYVIYKEGKYWVEQGLNIDVSSFGNTINKAKKNLQEAIELYFEDEKK